MATDPSYAALLLGAEPGIGFDQPKLLSPFGAVTLLEHVVAQAASWNVGLVVVVLGSDGEEIAQHVRLEDAVLVIDPEWEEGPAASLRAGLDAITRLGDADAALISYADAPAVDAGVVDALVSRDRVRPITVATYRYAPGPPYVVSSELWQRLMGLEGHASVESIMKVHPEWVEEVWFGQLAPRRITTVHDLADLAPRH